MRRTGSAKTVALAVQAVLAMSVVSCGGSSDPGPLIDRIEVTPSTASREVGQSVQLSAAVKDAEGVLLSGFAVTWSTSAANVASVSSSGLVTAVSIGSAIISATNGNKTGVSTINVIPPPPEPVASVTVSPLNDTLLVGETVQLAATTRLANNNVVTDRPITFLSSSPTIASVSNGGLVTGVRDGVTTITASSEGRSASANIRVFGPCSTALARPIAVGETFNGALAATDCVLDDSTYADGYLLQVTAATTVQIDMTASFDTYLFLLELLPTGQLVQRAANDDLDPDDPQDPADPINTNSRVTFALQPGAIYFILANSFDPKVFGNYQLSVTATAFFSTRQAGYTKPGKAPVETLMKAIRPPR